MSLWVMNVLVLRWLSVSVIIEKKLTFVTLNLLLMFLFFGFVAENSILQEAAFLTC